MNTEHTSMQFDAELEDVKSSIIQMGTLAIQQFKQAVNVLNCSDPELIKQVLSLGQQVNGLEAEIEQKCNLIFAQRQHEANDPRKILTALKITSDIERISDQTELIIRRAEMLFQQGGLKLPCSADIDRCGSLVLGMASNSMEAFAKLDSSIAAQVVYQDIEVNEEYGLITRNLIGHMLEDPRSISSALDFLFVAKAIARIGDYAKNIAKYVILMAKGHDVRQTPTEEIIKSSL